MSEPTEIRVSSIEEGWDIWNLTKLGVNIERSGKVGRVTVWATLEQPPSNWLPVARQVEEGSAQPERTRSLDDVKETIKALIHQADKALQEIEAEIEAEQKAEESGW